MSAGRQAGRLKGRLKGRQIGECGGQEDDTVHAWMNGSGPTGALLHETGGVAAVIVSGNERAQCASIMAEASDLQRQTSAHHLLSPNHKAKWPQPVAPQRGL